VNPAGLETRRCGRNGFYDLLPTEAVKGIYEKSKGRNNPAVPQIKERSQSGNLLQTTKKRKGWVS